MNFFIALVGCHNVGKSTLFNRLTSTNHALISSCAGITRDRQYGYLNSQKFKAIVIDTGGIGSFIDKQVDPYMQSFVNYQTNLAIDESELILFIVDGKLHECSLNYDMLNVLRKRGKNIFIIVNKIDDISYYESYVYMSHDYYSFGIDTVIFISAMHGYGINVLLDRIFFKFFKHIVDYSNINKNLYTDDEFGSCKKKRKTFDISLLSSKKNDAIVKIGIIGRPNSGKSTLVNCILGMNRVITSSIPGTTRNSIDIPVIFDKKKYVLMDTAGIRKKNNISDLSEQISIKKTFQVMEIANVVLFIIDANIGVSNQDLSLLKFIVDHGKALVIVLNKWDLLSQVVRQSLRVFLYKKMKFLDFIKIHFVSALYGVGISNMFQSVRMAYVYSSNFFMKQSIITSSKLTQILYQSIKNNPLPLLGKTRIKPKYVHIGGYNPLILVIHGSKVSQLSNTYRKYLIRCFYQSLNITGVALRIQLKDTVNPFLTYKNK